MYAVANARSRSAPARGDSTYRARLWPAFLEEPVEIKVYDVDDVERLAKWQAHETEVRSPCSDSSTGF